MNFLTRDRPDGRTRPQRNASRRVRIAHQRSRRGQPSWPALCRGRVPASTFVGCPSCLLRIDVNHVSRSVCDDSSRRPVALTGRVEQPTPFNPTWARYRQIVRTKTLTDQFQGDPAGQPLLLSTATTRSGPRPRLVWPSAGGAAHSVGRADPLAEVTVAAYPLVGAGTKDAYFGGDMRGTRPATLHESSTALADGRPVPFVEPIPRPVSTTSRPATDPSISRPPSTTFKRG